MHTFEIIFQHMLTQDIKICTSYFILDVQGIDNFCNEMKSIIIELHCI